MTSNERYLLAGIALVTITELVIWALFSAIYLYLRTGDPFGPVYTPAQLTQHNQLAGIATAMLILSIAATLAFFLRRRGFGLRLLAAIQVADVVAIVVLRNLQGLEDWSGSLSLSVGPAITLLLLALMWRRFARRASSLKTGPSV